MDFDGGWVFVGGFGGFEGMDFPGWIWYGTDGN